MGVVKGHALKIVINIKKEEEKAKKKSVADNKSKVESTLDESAIRKVDKKEETQLPEIFALQTDSIPLERIKKQFCLYCFSRSD